jgi:membrane-associated two-gene conflict system component 1 (EACC1)
MRGETMELADSGTAQITISDPAYLGSLQGLLQWAAPGVRVLPVPAAPGPDGSGDLPALALTASTGGLAAAVTIVPEFLWSRPAGLAVTISARGDAVTLTAATLGEGLAAAQRLLDRDLTISGSRRGRGTGMIRTAERAG